jgi:hypothetical protein
MEHNQEHHQLLLEKTHAAGAEEWYCPTCGRRLLISWPPDYKKIVLESGDDYAVHSGGKGGLSIGAVQVSQEEDTSHHEDDASLAPWIEWMEKEDFDSLWDQ